MRSLESAADEHMRVHWRDLDDSSPRGPWRGLLLTVDHEPSAKLTVTVSPPRCLRIASRNRALLWTRVDDDYWGYELLRSNATESPGVIPPIPFDRVREHSGVRGADSDRAWAREYATLIARSPASPMSTGLWVMGFVRGAGQTARDLPEALVQRIVAQRLHGYVEWDITSDVYPVALRKFSTPESGRVHAWRKHARAGTLPPILLWWVTGLSAHVVLDGHDRLLAAALEGVPARALALEAVEEHPADEAVRSAVSNQIAQALTHAEQARKRANADRRLISVDDANRVLLSAFVPELRRGATRARVFPYQDWAAEVRHELAAQGIAESRLLSV